MNIKKLFLKNFLIKVASLSILSLTFACSNSLMDAPISELVGIESADLRFNSKTISFSNCSELETFHKEQLIKSLRVKAYSKIYSFRRDYTRYKELGGAEGGGFDAPDAAPASEPAPEADSGPTKEFPLNQDHSSTNVQELGVDEADIVKTNGNHLYVVDRGQVHILDVSNAARPRKLNSIQISSEALQDIYLYRNELVIRTSFFDAPDDPTEGKYYVRGEEHSKVYFYDVRSPGEPRLKYSLSFEGSTVASRRIQDHYYFISQSHLKFRSQFTDGYSYGYRYNDPEGYIRYVQQTLNGEIERVNLLETKDILPPAEATVHSSEGGSESLMLKDTCKGWSAPADGNGNSFLKVTSVKSGNSGSDLDVQAAGVVSNWGTTYMSSDALYYASSNNWFPVENFVDESGSGFTSLTGVYKFGLSSSGALVYSATGMVPGWVNDQFSMSEHNHFLRIGTTIGTGFWRFSANRSNRLTILEQKENQLSEVGVIDNIAPSERIYSMRYDKEKAYMVTFRETDPLFTFDLSDPRNPKILGELKVDGFSTYIHLFGENNNRLLTIGRSATTRGWITGNQLQIFDVSDLKNPRQVSVYELGFVESEAVYDHHAFTYYAPRNTLVIPYGSYTCTFGINGGCYYESGSKVFDVSNDRLSLTKTLMLNAPDADYSSHYLSKRNVIIGDRLYLTAQNRVLVADLDSFSDISTIDLP